MSSKEKVPIQPEEEPLKEKEEPLTEKKEQIEENLENRSFVEKLCYLKSNISVEPIMAGLIIPSMLSRIAVQNLNLEKACRVKLELGDDICSALIRRDPGFNNTYYEGEVQKIISGIETWKSVVQTAIPTLLVIFMGAWSDRSGNRKLPILLPIIGELLTTLSNLMSTVFFNEISVEATMFLEAIFPALTGGWVMLYLGVFSYLSDITNEGNRTFRVGMANLCMTAGIPIGTALSGVLLNLLGYYGIFSITSVIYVMTLAYGLIYLKKKTKPGSEDTKVKPLRCKDMVTMLTDTAGFAFRKREGNQRIKILMCLLIVGIIYGPGHGERIVFYMYLRYRLNWDALKYSIYSTYSIITHSLGALFSISVFSKRWGFHDSVLCLISITSELIGSIFIIFVRNDFQMFMVPLIEILNATTFTSLRSMASKLVPSEEIGKMNSVFSLVETIAALIFDPTYSALYRRTVGLFTGAVFLFSGLMTLPPIFMLLWFFTQHRREVKRKRKDDCKNHINEMVVETPEVVLET